MRLQVPFRKHNTRAGFTLLEALIALSIVAIAVTLLTRAHIQTLRAEAFARILNGAVIQAETVVNRAFLGEDPRALNEDAGAAGWVVESDVVNTGPGMAWQTWKVAASNAPSPAVTVYVRPRG